MFVIALQQLPPYASRPSSLTARARDDMTYGAHASTGQDTSVTPFTDSPNAISSALSRWRLLIPTLVCTSKEVFFLLLSVIAFSRLLNSPVLGRASGQGSAFIKQLSREDDSVLATYVSFEFKAKYVSACSWVSTLPFHTQS